MLKYIRIPHKLSKLAPGFRVRGLLVDSAWQFGETLFGMLMALFVGALVARHLSTDGFGTMTYVVAVMSLVGSFTRFGLDSVVTREVATNPANSHMIVSTVIKMTFITGLLGTASVLVLAFFGDHGQAIKAGLSIAAIGGIIGPLSVHQAVLRANFLSGKASRYKIILAAVFGAIRLSMVFADAPVLAFIVTMVIEESTAYLLYYVLCQKFNLLIKPLSRPTIGFLDRARPLAAEGFPLMISFIMIAIYSRLDVIMVENYHGIHETGLYSAGARLSEIWHVIPGILVGTFLPHFAQIKIDEPERFLRTISKFSAVFFWGSLFVIGFTYFAAPLLIRLLFGPAFSDAAVILRIHIFCLTSVCMGGLVSYWYILEKLQRLLIIASSIGVLSNVLLNLVWIPKYGGAGAALATAVSYSLSVIGPLLLSSKTQLIRRTIFQGILLRNPETRPITFDEL